MEDKQNAGRSELILASESGSLPGGDYATLIGLTEYRGGILTSLNLKDPNERHLLFGAMNGECQSADEHMNQELSVSHIVLSPASKADEKTGQVDRWTRCVLILASGDMVEFGSQGILKSLWLYSLCYTNPPWDPAAKLTLKSRAIGKNRWYELQPPKRPVSPPIAQPVKR